MEHRDKNRTVVILGGGYAGLSCIAELRRIDPTLEIHLFDPHTDHCRLTALHKTFRQHLDTCHTPFPTLASRFRFRHHRKSVSFDTEILKEWNRTRTVRAGGLDLPFDALVVTTGGLPKKLPEGRNVFTTNDIRVKGGKSILEDLSGDDAGKAFITIVGGGATGIQVLFEIDHALKAMKRPATLRLVDPHANCLAGLPEALASHTRRVMTARGITFLPQTRYSGQHGEEIRLEDLTTGERYLLPSNRTLLCPGVLPSPCAIETTEKGEVLSGKTTLESVFAAGDVSRFRGRGLNALSAQAAIQKGMTVARNIVRLFQKRTLLPYDYREQGYFVSLGPDDAAGWIWNRSILVKGKAAVLLKEGAEIRYELLLHGIKTFLPPLFRG